MAARRPRLRTYLRMRPARALLRVNSSASGASRNPARGAGAALRRVRRLPSISFRTRIATCYPCHQAEAPEFVPALPHVSHHCRRYTGEHFKQRFRFTSSASWLHEMEHQEKRTQVCRCACQTLLPTQRAERVFYVHSRDEKVACVLPFRGPFEKTNRNTQNKAKPSKPLATRSITHSSRGLCVHRMHTQLLCLDCRCSRARVRLPSCMWSATPRPARRCGCCAGPPRKDVSLAEDASRNRVHSCQSTHTSCSGARASRVLFFLLRY